MDNPSDDGQSAKTLFDQLLDLRDEQRVIRKKGLLVVKGKQTPWEKNRHGEMKWLVHPLQRNTAINTVILYEHRIPPGGRSGRQRHPGGQVIYVREGEGYSILDGVKFPWYPECVLTLPIRKEGVVYQHFNISNDQEAVLICCEPNFTDCLGVDRGSELEQLEDAPN